MDSDSKPEEKGPPKSWICRKNRDSRSKIFLKKLFVVQTSVNKKNYFLRYTAD